MDLFSQRLKDPSKVSISLPQIDFPLITDFSQSNLIEIVLSGVLIEIIEKPVLQNSIQLLLSFLYPYLAQDYQLSLLLSNIYNNKEKTEYIHSINPETLKEEILLISDRISKNCSNANDFYYLSYELNCKIIVFYESSQIVYSAYRYLRPSIVYLTLRYENSTPIIYLLLCKSYDNILLKESRLAKLKNIEKRLKNLISLSKEKQNLNEINKISQLVIKSSSEPERSSQYTFPDYSQTVESASPDTSTTPSFKPILKNLNIDLPNIPKTFNIFSKHPGKHQTLQYSRKPLSELDYKTSNKKPLEPLKLSSLQLPLFPSSQLFPDLSSIPVHEKYLPGQPRSSNTQPPDKGQVVPGPSGYCQICEIRDFFEVTFSCSCLMCYNCLAESAKKKHCVKCLNNLSQGEISRVPNFS